MIGSVTSEFAGGVSSLSCSAKCCIKSSKDHVQGFLSYLVRAAMFTCMSDRHSMKAIDHPFQCGTVLWASFRAGV